MKIVIAVHQFLPRHTTGTELYVYELAKALSADGHEVRIFTGEDDGASYLAEEDYDYEGLAVRRFSRHPSTEPPPHIAAWSSTFAESSFGRFLDQVQPDVVHFFHLFGLGGRLLDAAYCRGIPYLVHLMDYWFLCPRMQMLDDRGALCRGPETAERCTRCAAQGDGDYQALVDRLDAGESPRGFEAVGDRWPFLRERLERAALIVAPSNYLRDRFVAQGVPASSIETLRYGLDEARFQPKDQPRDGPFHFGFLGNLATYKGAHLAIEALGRLRSTDVRLSLYGDFFFREEAHVEACRAGIDADDRITLAGPFDHHELGAVLAGLDAVLVPSLWHENAPFVVLEALQSGTPVVASDVGGIAEIVTDGVDGLLFERGDVADLAAKMKALATDRSRFAPPWESSPSLASNASWLAERYADIAAKAPPAEGATVERLIRDFHARMQDALLGLVAPLEELAGDRDALTRLRGYERMEQDLAGHREALAELREIRAAEMEAMTSTESTLRAELASTTQALEDVRADLAGHRDALAAVSVELDAHREAVESLRTDNENLRAHSATIGAALEEHRVALEEFRALAESRQETLVRLQGELGASEAARDSLAAQCDRALRVVADASATADEQQAYVAQMKARLQALVQTIDSSAHGPNL